MHIPIAMWTPSVWELGIILVIVLVLFGAGKLPQVFGQLGKAVKSFRDGQAGAADDDDDDLDVTPAKKELSGSVEDAHEVKSKAEA